MLLAIAGMMGTCHLAQLFLLRWDLENFFLPGLALKGSPPISAFHIAKMTGMFYHMLFF
jgi:hypothetical protein